LRSFQIRFSLLVSGLFGFEENLGGDVIIVSLFHFKYNVLDGGIMRPICSNEGFPCFVQGSLTPSEIED
jgi:hypothetical protein